MLGRTKDSEKRHFLPFLRESARVASTIFFRILIEVLKLKLDDMQRPSFPSLSLHFTFTIVSCRSAVTDLSQRMKEEAGWSVGEGAGVAPGPGTVRQGGRGEGTTDDIMFASRFSAELCSAQSNQ